jgi:hypothetical protein
MNLSDGGFLYDPESKYAKYVQSDVLPFEDIADRPCLALLGEPGIGKSTVMEELRASTVSSVQPGGAHVLYMNLNEYGDESRLIRELFEDEKFLTWRSGNHTLHLFLDSLDECGLQIPQVGSILGNHFERLSELLGRLRLRIACRTADWPVTLDGRLPSLWGRDNFGAYELAPLRRDDVRLAATTEGVEADAFMAALERTETVPLAIKPVTLRFLLSVYEQDGRLPTTRAELYEQGCKLLCEEQNPNRRELARVGGMGALSAAQRLDVASRIAAIATFCQKPTVRLSPGEGLAIGEEATIAEIANETELRGRPGETLPEEHIRETLGTGLFSSRGPDKMGFAHQTHGEFLASRYLDKAGVGMRKKLAILQHHGDLERRIVPQLYQVAAWVAGLDEELFSATVQNEPEVLLRCDEGALAAHQRAALVEAFLSALADGRANARDWDLHRHYHKLAHRGMGDRLRPWITDSARDSASRNVAIDIAEACMKAEVQSALVEVALDENEPERLRSNAAHAVAIVGDPATRKLLRPLALGKAGGDEMDQLKGNALRGLWPGLIGADELFGLLTPPKRENFAGTYDVFVNYELAKHLDERSLPFALEWLANQARHRRIGFPFNGLADEIVTVGWQAMRDPAVRRGLARATAEHFASHHDLVEEHETREEYASMFESPDSRRLLFRAMVDDRVDVDVVADCASPWLWPRLLREGDLGWCVHELLKAQSSDIEHLWAKVVTGLLTWAEPSCELLATLSEGWRRSSLLRGECGGFFGSVALDSDHARKMKERHDWTQKPRQGNKPARLDSLPRDRIEHWLRRCEGREHDAWWMLLLSMTLEDTSEEYSVQLLFDAETSALPGWRKSATKTRERILDAAERYLNATIEFDADRLLNSSFAGAELGPYKAFTMLLSERDESVASFPRDVWSFWVPVLLGPFASGDREGIQKLLISLAYSKTPEVVAHRLQAIVRHDIAKKDRYLSVLELIVDIYDQRIADLLHNLLPEAQAEPACWSKILKLLLTRAHLESQRVGESKLTLPLPNAHDERQIALQAALALIQIRDDAAWSLVWPVLSQDGEFGRQLMVELAYGCHHDYADFFAKLGEGQLGDLFIWLVEQFPYEQDPERVAVYRPEKEDSVRDLRTAIVNFLEKAGTPESCDALKRIADTLTKLTWLKSVLVEARRNTLHSTWRPLRVREFLQITSRRESALVRDATELQELLLDWLRDVEKELQGKYAAPDLWNQLDKDRWRPKDENHLSDWVTRYLEPKLEDRGIVVAREVQIRRGEHTDIHVTAIIPGVGEDTLEQVRVIVEAKGCWHQDLRNAMQTQLVERYLKDNECQHGIYLVGWYDCAKWDDADGRKKRMPKWSREEAAQFFERQAQELSTADLRIRAVVLNTALRKGIPCRPNG